MSRRLASHLRANRRGYTAVEVLISLTVFAIGAASVIAMERAAVQGNVDARRLDTANSIARAVTDRLRREAMTWNLNNNIAQAATINANLGSGNWALADFGCPASAAAATPADGRCYAFDAMGQDLDTANAANAIFCANIKVDTVAQDPSLNPTVIRANVRVFWPKGIDQAPAGGATGFCSAASMSDTTKGPSGSSAAQIYHFVYSVTLISNSQVQQ